MFRVMGKHARRQGRTALFFLVFLSCGPGIYSRDPHAHSMTDGSTDAASEGELGSDALAADDCRSPNPSITRTIAVEGGELQLCEIRLVFPKGSLAGALTVTITRVSPEGFLHNTQAVGPVYSISRSEPLGTPAALEFRFTPFQSNVAKERLAIAYFQPLARLWISDGFSQYDASTGTLSMRTMLAENNREFAPFLTCGEGSACENGQTCQSGMCQ